MWHVKEANSMARQSRRNSLLVLGIIGDTCDNDNDCTISHSSCADGICVCDVNYDASKDGLLCKSKYY